jgi:diguanylate cyclase (GGDEF)-like protein
MEIVARGPWGESREPGQAYGLFGGAARAERAALPSMPAVSSLDRLLKHRIAGVAVPNSSVDERARQLAGMALFRGMPEAELRPLAAATDVVLYEPGERIVKQGEPGESVYLIIEGKVEVLARTVQGSIVTETTVAWMTAGDAMGELSLLDGQPRSASCVAVTPITCLRLGREAFLRALQEHWSLSHALHVVLAQRLRMADQLLAEHACDPLTGLNNRRALTDLYEREAQRVRHVARQNGTQGLNPLAVVFVDVNHFKEINDTYGHQTGDEVLKRIAELLTSVSRATDLVSRYGGDEFVLLLPDAGIHGAELVVGRIRERLAEQPPGPVPFTLSLGYALVDPEAPQGLDALLTQADLAMYQDKAATRLT